MNEKTDGDMLRKLAPDYNVVNHMNIEDEKIQSLFTIDHFRHRTFRYTQYCDCESFLGRMQSSSYSPAKASSELSALNRAAVTLFEEFAIHGKLSFEYSSHLYLGQLGS